jgi:hypothetical protein
MRAGRSDTRRRRSSGRCSQPAVWGAISTGEVSVAAAYESFDELMRPFAAGVGHSGACFTSLGPAVQAELAADVHGRLGSPLGRFELTAHAWWVRGTVPV